MSSPESARPFLSLQNAAFRLGERLVFQNTTWTLRRHEQWAILGPNGSGKSLLADALRGRLPLVQGELEYHFRPPAGSSPEEAIGHVSFEDRKLDLHETVVQSRWNSLEEEDALLVRDFLSYERVTDLNPFAVTPQHDRARAHFAHRLARAVSLFQISPLLSRALLSLSNGERQRVQLARAFCLPLRLLILDEPFAGLDIKARADFHRLLERLMSTPLRVLLITTRPEDLPRHITHVLWVDGCRVTGAEPRREVRLPKRDKGKSETRLKRTWLRDALSSVLPLPRYLSSAVAQASSPASFGGVSPPISGPRTETVRELAGGDACARLNTFLPRGEGRGEKELVQLRNVTVQYDNTVILNNINWTVRAGESWALLGPNGSGKTTLLSLLLGDNPQAYRNHVVVFGKQRGSGESIWDLKRRIGWVSPELHLHFDAAATCLETVASGFHDTIGLFEPPTARQRARARNWLARFGLKEFKNSPLYGLSAGLQRMVLLARALVKRPRLLILDEPCQGLDAAHRALFIRTVDALIRNGEVTAIYVTHRQDEIPPAIQRVLRLGTRLRIPRCRSHRREEADNPRVLGATIHGHALSGTA